MGPFFALAGVNTSGSAPQLDEPHILFQVSGVQRQSGPFDVTADGKNFLVNTGNLKEGSDPLTLVLNWTVELKKRNQGRESSVSFSPAVGYTGLRP
jgi:hypothetical protein